MRCSTYPKEDEARQSTHQMKLDYSCRKHSFWEDSPVAEKLYLYTSHKQNKHRNKNNLWRNAKIRRGTENPNKHSDGALMSTGKLSRGRTAMYSVGTGRIMTSQVWGGLILEILRRDFRTYLQVIASTLSINSTWQKTFVHDLFQIKLFYYKIIKCYYYAEAFFPFKSLIQGGGH